jgi:asparagine synthase (glutamine-hydrolysing)
VSPITVRTVALPRAPTMANPADAWRALDVAWEEALSPLRAPTGPLVVLFSGGVDSGLLAWELRSGPNVSLFTVGTDGADDLPRSRAAAERLGLPWSAQRLGPEELDAVVAATARELEGVPRPRRGIFLALGAAVSRAPLGTLLVGQGADELFLGYAHYRGLDGVAAARRAGADLDLLLGSDWPRTVAIASRFGRSVLAPYLHPSFVRAALSVPIEARLPLPMPKAWFRAWARQRGLPEPLVSAPKRAIQYGSGVDRLLRRRAGPRARAPRPDEGAEGRGTP